MISLSLHSAVCGSALGGSTWSLAAADAYLAQHLSPPHLDPATAADPSLSHFLAVNGGGEDGGGDAPSAGERWYRELESKIFASPAVISGQVNGLLKQWPDPETYREIQALERNGVKEALAALARERRSTIPSRMNALSALVVVEGIDAAAPLIPALHEMWLLKRLEGLETIERDEFLRFMGFGRVTVFLDSLEDGIGPELIGLMAGAEMLREGLDFVLFCTPSGRRMAALRSLGNLLLLSLDLLHEVRSGVDPKRMERLSVWGNKEAPSEKTRERGDFSLGRREFASEEIRKAEEGRANRAKREELVLSLLDSWPEREAADMLKRLGESGADLLEGIVWDSRLAGPLRSKALSALMSLGEPSLAISSKFPIVESLLSKNIEAHLLDFFPGATALSVDPDAIALMGALFLIRKAIGVLSEKKPDTVPLIQKTHEDSVALFGLARLCLLEDLVFKHAETFRTMRGRSSEEERRETEDLWEAFRNRIKAEEEWNL